MGAQCGGVGGAESVVEGVEGAREAGRWLWGSGWDGFGVLGLVVLR